MEIGQKDRDALRALQDKLNPSFKIGNIIEHKVQDPRRYKTLSREQQGLKDTLPTMPIIKYESAMLSDDSQFGGSQTSDSQDDLPSIIERPEHEDLPITMEDVHANMWLNMNKLEIDKLEWMSNKAEKAFKEKLKSSTHFDKDGRAIPPDAVDERSDQQAHDIGSLVKLLDSTYHPQITYSLNVISKIATLAVMGYYDSAFDQNIHQMLLEECLLRVRHHVDSPNETICLSALKCLRSLLCNTPIDEVFLDRNYPIYNDKPERYWLYPIHMADLDFTDEMKDNECVAVDPIMALVMRTELIARLTYLLEVKTNEFKDTYRDCILDILLRMARHSKELCYVMSAQDIPRLVVDKLLPSSIAAATKAIKSQASRALKFLRITVDAAREIDHEHAATKIKLFKDIMKPIPAYYHSDSYKGISDNHMLVLHIETLRIMKALSYHEMFVKDVYDTIIMDVPYLYDNIRMVTHLDPMREITSRISLDWQLAAHLIDLIGFHLAYELYQSHKTVMNNIWQTFIGPTAIKWMQDIVHGTSIPHIDVSITISGIVRHALKGFLKTQFESIECFRLMIPLWLGSENLAKDKPSGQHLFNHLLQKATCQSRLVDILDITGTRRDPDRLPSFGYLNYNTHEHYDYTFHNSVEIDSPFVLLGLYADLILKNESLSKKLLKTPRLARYLKIATGYHNKPHSYETLVHKSIFCQHEIEIMSKLLVVLAKDQLVRPVAAEAIISAESNPATARDSQIESCASLIFEAISIVALTSQDQDHLLALKSTIIESIVLNSGFHREISEVTNEIRSSYEHIEFERSNHLTGNHQQIGPIGEASLHLLRMIYMKSEKTTRFWLLQPLIDYYKNRIALNGQGKKVTRNPHWFREALGLNYGCHGTTEYSDSAIISYILSLNLFIMRTSPNYNSICIRQNIEDYLCLIASIFLDDDIFFDKVLSEKIRLNIMAIIRESLLGNRSLFAQASKRLDLLDLVLADFFNKIVDQYEAASYGDQAFANFLLLFINPSSDSVFKKKLFSEKLETCLAQIRLTPIEVFAPDEVFLGQREKDPEVVQLIRSSGSHIRDGTFLNFYRRHVLGLISS